MMQKAHKIAAFLLLGLFGLMVLHQAFPHLHHQHQDSYSHSDVAHTGEHHHHDNGSHEDEESPYGFFGFFMDMHVHSSVSTDIIVERQIVEHRTDTNENVVKTNSGLTTNRRFIIRSTTILILSFHPSIYGGHHL